MQPYLQSDIQLAPSQCFHRCKDMCLQSRVSPPLLLLWLPKTPPQNSVPVRTQKHSPVGHSTHRTSHLNWLPVQTSYLCCMEISSKRVAVQVQSQTQPSTGKSVCFTSTTFKLHLNIKHDVKRQISHNLEFALAKKGNIKQCTLLSFCRREHCKENDILNLSIKPIS